MGKEQQKSTKSKPMAIAMTGDTLYIAARRCGSGTEDGGEKTGVSDGQC